MSDSIVGGETWQRHERICGLRDLIERSFLQVGEDLLWMKDTRSYRQLGHPTFESYIADPDVDIGRRSAYMAMRCFEVYVSRLHIDEPLLLEAGTSKLDLCAPHVTPENADELVSMAAALSRSDLRDALDDMFGEGATPPLSTDYRTRYIWARRVLRRKYWKHNERRTNNDYRS